MDQAYSKGLFTRFDHVACHTAGVAHFSATDAYDPHALLGPKSTRMALASSHGMPEVRRWVCHPGACYLVPTHKFGCWELYQVLDFVSVLAYSSRKV